MATDTIGGTEKRTDRAVLAELQRSLLELIDIALVGKQAHWNVVGPLFKPVHEQLDDIVEAARHSADEVAERIAALGGVPDGTPRAIADAKPFEPFADGNVTTDQAIELIGARLEEFSRRLRPRFDRLGEADPISQGILIEAGEVLEKQAWMLRAQRS